MSVRRHKISLFAEDIKNQDSDHVDRTSLLYTVQTRPHARWIHGPLTNSKIFPQKKKQIIKYKLV